MALSGLDFPTDIRWERVCVTGDMLDAVGDDAVAPPRWQSSIAVFRFVPEEKYQLYPERRIVYFKVTCTISSYQPKTDEVEGVARSGYLTVAEISELDRKLQSYAPCHGAIVHVTVTPKEDGVAIEDYPYIADVQPRQRAMYEQSTESTEVASRSLDEVDVSKGGGSSRSQEVLDIDRGSSANVNVSAQGSYAGVGGGVGLGGGYSRSVEMGTKTLGQQDRSRLETTDSVRETRETTSHTTQLSHMYTLLQSYHVGTNRVMFYVTPRPHPLEKPSGFIRGPRRIDGVQEFFLIVNQDAAQELPCVSVRLDTGHLTTTEDYDHDYTSEPPTELSVNALGLPPGELDPNKIPAAEGGDPGFSANYDCFESPTAIDEASATARAGYVVHKVTDIGAKEVNRGSVDIFIDPPAPEVGRSVKLTAKATGHACYRNQGGDAVNTGALTSIGTGIFGPLGTLGGFIAGVTGSDAPGLEEVKAVEIGYARHTVRVHWKTEAKTKKTGERQVLLVTTRVLHCCDQEPVPPKIVGIIPLDIVELQLELPPPQPIELQLELPPPQPELRVSAPEGDDATRPIGSAVPGPDATTEVPGMSASAANELAALAMAETARVADSIDSPGEARALDTELALARVAEMTLAVPRLRRMLARPVGTIDGLTNSVERQLVEMPLPDSPSGVAPSRLALASLPNSTLAEGLGLNETDALQLRLAALGVAEAPHPSHPPEREA